MKKADYLLKNVFSLALAVLLFNSCSNTQESKLVYTESNTIKQSVKDKEQDITWTSELEGERLTKRINRNSITIGNDVPYNKELFKISQKSQIPVYPSISDFGSLDTSRLNPSVKEKITNFCKSFNSPEYGGSESYFSYKYIFNYVFFLKDFEEGWKSNFSKTLPEKDLFKKWVFGEPFNGADIIQIPVRFYTDYGTIDVVMFLDSSGNNDFYQITIDRWQKV